MDRTTSSRSRTANPLTSEALLPTALHSHLLRAAYRPRGTGTSLTERLWHSARQGLSPRWFWVTVGATAGPLLLVPLWHHGREWKNTSRKVGGWLFFMAAIAYVVWSFLQGREER